jgi:hypothetical protein
MLRLQLNWKGEDKRDLSPSTVAFTDVLSAPQWQESSMMIRAPPGSKYAAVHAGAASGKIWVDDYSLTKLADDCQPVLFVTPNPVSVSAGQLGHAAISWNTYRSSEGRVTLAVDGGAEAAFAGGRSGLQMLDGIKPGTRYQFRLYSSPETMSVGTIALSARTRTATIAAEPNPIPSGPGLGRTKIYWATLAGENGEVYVSQDAGPEHLFARAPAGSAEVKWIAAGSRYEFRLYTANGARRLVAKVIVTR